jgi:hypothetical protein
MSYEVRCECGKAHAVGAADAGASLRCTCGRTVDIPPLHQLRTAGGVSSIPIVAQVRAAIMNGLLPGTTLCASCGANAGSRCSIKIVCERVRVNEGLSQAEKVGCLIAPWVGLWVLLFGAAARRHRAKVGDEVALLLPLPICNACRPKLSDSTERAIRAIPDYAALLDQYPKAELTIIA